MKNKIVELRNGTSICRILDTVIYKGDTAYLVIEFKTRALLTISPKDIFDIVELDKEGKFNSIRDILIKKGL
jgi:hypothetical protein